MHAQDSDTIETDVALAILRECLRQADVDDRDLVSIPFSQIKDLRWVVVKWATDTTFQVRNLIDVERRLNAIVRYDNTVGGKAVERVLTGQLDALFVEGEFADHAVVLDWKDTWALPPESGISEHGYFQQRFYAYLVFANFPSIQTVTLREFYVRFSEAREASVSRRHFENMQEELAALAERFDRTFEAEAWRPAPGKHCSFCALPAKCPIFSDVRGAGAISSDEDAQRVVAEIIVAKAALKRREDAARAWANAHGDIAIKAAKDPNRVLGFVTTKRTARPDRETMERALREGLTLDEVYKTSKSTRFQQHTNDPEAEADTKADDELKAALEESVRRKQANVRKAA